MESTWNDNIIEMETRLTVTGEGGVGTENWI